MLRAKAGNITTYFHNIRFVDQGTAFMATAKNLSKPEIRSDLKILDAVIKKKIMLSEQVISEGKF
jgi:hypothetical protein